MQVTASAMTLSPSVDMLTHPDTNFPVYIDPGYDNLDEIWTVVSRKNPTTSYWSGNGYRDYMRVGQNWQSSADDDWRTLARFSTAQLKKTEIIKASVHVNVWHTADCVPSPFQLWVTNSISRTAPVTWNSTKDKTWKRLAEVKATANKQFCPKDGNDEVGFKSSALKKAFQDAADRDQSAITLAFKAKSEGDEKQWKKLKADSAYLDIDYNHRPGKVGERKVSPCLECTAPVATPSRKPKLTMKATDPDGGKLKYQYRVYESTRQKIVASTELGGIASGAKRTWTVAAKPVAPAKVWPGLSDGTYYWIGRACDSYNQCGPWSATTDPIAKIIVDNENPKSPVITSDLYSENAWKGGVGQSSKFTFRPGTASDNVYQYQYQLNGGEKRFKDADSNGITEVPITPTKDSQNVLTVKAIDKAGNLSGVSDFEFWVALEKKGSWYWSLDEGEGTSAESVPEKNNRPAGISGSGVAWSSVGMMGSAGSAQFAGQGQFTTSSVLKTTAVAGFTVASWVRLPSPETSDAPPEEPETPGTGEDGDPGGIGDDPDSEDSPPVEPEEPPAVTLPTANQASVSQDGNKRSMFRLGYRTDLNIDKSADGSPDPGWCFTIAAADTVTASETAVCTTEYVATGEWTHLAAVADPLTNEIRLYVNGTPSVLGSLTAATGKATWDSTGDFAIGRGLGATTTERWIGWIDEVYALPRVWNDGEINMRAKEPEEWPEIE